MPQSFDGITYLCGDEARLYAMRETPALPAFSEKSLAFLSALSKAILADARTREYPDLTDYAFWIRRASLNKMQSARPQMIKKLGRGVALHIAPSNVPVAFAMSFTAALLAGNASIVRVSDKFYAQVDIFADAVNGLFNGAFAEMVPYLCLVRYGHSEELTAALSALCDVRMIWGGNRTIEAIRKAELPPRAIELTFADRYSIAVIDADAYLQMDADAVAKLFYMDTYYIDQNACSSPRLVYWIGTEAAVAVAQESFWRAIGALAHKDYELKPIQTIDKYTAYCELAMNRSAFLLPGDNYVTRVRLDELAPEAMAHKEGGGYFFEYAAQDISALPPMLQKSCQTISCLGVDMEALRQLIRNAGVRGADRIVPMGKTMKMTLMWDGYDLSDSLSRYISLDEEE